MASAQSSELSLRSEAGGELIRAVEISEGVKRVAAITARISRVGINAIVLAHRAGDLARGFGVLSNELRTFTQQVTVLMTKLSQTSLQMVESVSALLRQSHNVTLLKRTQHELRRRDAPPMVDAVLDRRIGDCRQRKDELGRLQRELQTLLEEARQSGQFGTVLARTARIEVTYAGTHAAELGDVAKEFGLAINQIVDSLEQLSHTNHSASTP